MFSIKQENFTNITSNESISKTFAQRHYMQFTDAQISENMAWLRKDAALRWELAQIEAAGPNWREQQAALAQAAQGGAAPGGMGGMGGGGMAGGEMGGGAGGTSEFPEFGAGGAPGAAPGAEGGAPAAGAPAAGNSPETAAAPENI